MTEAAERQFVACTFRKGDAKTYTYHNDGEPLQVGDEVEIDGRYGKRQRVYIAAIDVAKPSFDTKPILGKAPPKELPL